MLVKEPKKADNSTAQDKEEELRVSPLIVGEFVNEDLRAGDVDECPASYAQHDRADQGWGIFNDYPNNHAERFNQRETEKDEKDGLF